jgi:arginyl-tRNA synthetase
VDIGPGAGRNGGQVVNARAAAVGDALARILISQGHGVLRQFYVNDAGNQFEALARSVDVRLRQALGEPAQLPENSYPGEYLVDLVTDWIATDAEGMRAMVKRRRPSAWSWAQGRRDHGGGPAEGARSLRDEVRQLDARAR